MRNVTEHVGERRSCDVHDDRILGEQRIEHGLSQQQTVGHELDLGLFGFRFVVKANGVTDLNIRTLRCGCRRKCVQASSMSVDFR